MKASIEYWKQRRIRAEKAYDSACHNGSWQGQCFAKDRIELITEFIGELEGLSRVYTHSDKLDQG